MGLFSKWFGKEPIKTQPVPRAASAPGLTPEQFLYTAQVTAIIKRYQKETIVLNPKVSEHPLSLGISKFGGMPNGNGFVTYPCCDNCGTPLNFVLQLYRTDFPEHYFPEGKDLFQLFRCPDDSCTSGYSEHYDRKMFLYYFANPAGEPQDLPIPEARPNDEPQVPDCILKPAHQPDFPIYEDFDDAINDLEKQFGETLTEVFTDQHHAIQRTKIGGYPSFTQSPFYPTCSCGQEKAFFFQLSSEDTDEERTKAGDWSPHGIMIGDVGNIYFYVCRSCGEQSIETYWDCY